MRIETLEAREVPAAFTPGNLVIYRVGTSTEALSNAATAVFLDEYSPAGSLIQSVAMPTADDGLNQTLTSSGTSPAEGYLSRSADGGYLLVPGYDAAPGTAAIGSSSTATVPRVLGRVAYDSTINTTSTTTSFSGSSIHGVASTNGTDLWAVGNNTGVVYTPLGGSGAGTVVSADATSLRTINIFDGQLYASSGSGANTFRGVNMVGSGVPTTTGHTVTRLPGLTDSENPSDYQFFFADLSSSVAGVDTLYIADDGDGGLMKWTLGGGGTWSISGAIGGTSDDYRGVTGIVSGTTVTLFAIRKGGSGSTGGGEFVSVSDASGYDGILAGTPSLLATAATNTAFRGIALAPEHVNVAPVNTLPSTFPDLTEDAAKVLAGVSVADSDAGSGNIKVTISVPAGSGTFLLKDDVSSGVAAGDITGNNSRIIEITSTVAKINATLAHASGLTFTPGADVNGDVTLTMLTNDQGNTGAGGAREDTDTSTISIAEVNDPVAATDDGLSGVAEDSGSRTIPFADITVNDSRGPSNENGQSLTIISVSNAVGGTVGIVGTDVIFSPSPDFNGAASFDYVVQDNGTTNGAADFKSDTGEVTFTITTVNDAPNALTDPLSSVAEDLPVRTIPIADLMANDNPGPADESGQSLTFLSVSDPVGGTVSISGTDALFTPTADFNGLAGFDYVIEDNGTSNGSADPKSSTGHVSFSITEVNDAVTATDDTLPSIAEDSGDRTIPFLDLTGNDSAGPANESTQTLSIASVSNVVGGSIAIVETDLIFTPTLNFNGAASFDYLVEDNGTTNGSADFKSDTGHVTFTIDPVNDAPILDTTGTPMLPFIPKRGKVLSAGTVAGALLSDLTEHITDPPDVDPKGVAVTKIDNANGAWEYNLAFNPSDPTAGWAPIPTTVSATNGLLLSDDGDTRVRFIPNFKFKSLVSLTFKAWDQSNPPRVEGDFETNLTTTAYSTADDQAWIAVGATKPAVDADGRTILKPTKSDTKTSAAVSVKDMIGIAGLEAPSIINPGVAIIQNNQAEGKWEFQLFDAQPKVWVEVGAVSSTSALLLRPTDKLRFTPIVGVDGDAELKFLTWNQTGTAGTKLNPTGVAFGVDPGTAILDLVPVLDLSAAGVLNPVGANGTTNAVPFSSLMNANHVVGANLGVAITATKGTGTWEYSLDGVTWKAVGKVSTGKALFLDDSVLIRFTSINATPGTASLSFKAWDLTKVAPGSIGVASGTSVSKLREIVSVSVANTSPTLDITPAVTLKPISALAKPGSGATVSALLGTGFGDTDPKSLKGIAITGFTDNGGGKWQYLVAGSKVWIDLGTVGANSAILLASNAKVRYFVTNPLITTGDATISYKAWDRTTGQSGDRGVDTTGLLNAFSSSLEIETATITVTL